jgi:hypothetical protein
MVNLAEGSSSKSSCALTPRDQTRSTNIADGIKEEPMPGQFCRISGSCS